MHDDDFLNQKLAAVRECVIPNGTVKFVNLNLTTGENGIVTSCDPDPVRLEAVSFVSVANDALPIIMLKYQMYNQMLNF